MCENKTAVKIPQVIHFTNYNVHPFGRYSLRCISEPVQLHLTTMLKPKKIVNSAGMEISK